LCRAALRAASEHDCPSPPYFKLPEDDAAPGSPVASAKGLNGAAESGGDAGEGEADPAATIELLHLHDGVPGGAAQADAEPELQEVCGHGSLHCTRVHSLTCAIAGDIHNAFHV
jgi:hypothetical protein